MSEGDVSTIRDEDVLRRMWQQTEDFSRKKEIRAHMYRLREERLRSLYSPQDGEVKGSGRHARSLADHTFQSIKRAEVRDAASPGKEAADLKALSNAGWNVESENRTTDDGHTHERTVRADIEGRYDVEGGKGQFAAIDQQRKAVTEYTDGNTNVKKNESEAKTASKEQVVRQSDDGSHFSSTTSSSTATSKFLQTSSTETVPYVIDEGKKEMKVRQVSEHEQSFRNTAYGQGELVSKKVEYPDENTKVIVETRCLPDGTRVTNTRREFRVPATQTSTSEHHESRSESKYSTRSDMRQSASKVTQQSIDNSSRDVRESLKSVDDKRTHTDKTATKYVDLSTEHNVQSSAFKNVEHSTARSVDHSTSKREDYSTTKDVDYSTSARENQQRIVNQSDETRRSESLNRDTQSKITEDIITTDKTDHSSIKDSRDHSTVRDRRTDEVVDQTASNDQYQTTYQSDYTQKKRISSDLSPTHQAWASTLRADSPVTTRPSTRASSPGSRTNMSSTSSLRSSVSPDKYRKPLSRGGSPSKIDRQSPTRYDRFSNHSTKETMTTKYSSPERPRSSQSPDKYRQRPSQSPEKRPQDCTYKPSPTKSTTRDSYPRDVTLSRPSQTPERKPNHQQPDESLYPRARQSPGRKPGYDNTTTSPEDSTLSVSSDRKPGYMRPTASKPESDSPKSVPSRSPDRKADYGRTTTTTKVKEDHYKFIDAETKMYMRSDTDEIDQIKRRSSQSPSPSRRIPGKDVADYCRSESPLTPSLKKARSPSPPKGPVTFTEDIDDKRHSRTDNAITVESKQTDTTTRYDSTDYYKRMSQEKDTTKTAKSSLPVRELSPIKYGTYDKKQYSKETGEVTSITTEDIKNDTLTRSDKRRSSVKKQSSEPLSPTKKPRDSSSPVKSPVKDKNKHTTDFISTEKTTEEINKVTKDRPRQLITPSSSPTRNPKIPVVQTAPSTGQSSPTTSVSDIMYFSSPRQTETIITDLDDHFFSETSTQEMKTTFTRPETLNFARSPSPTKLPCRSPSPEKKSPIKENLPRKSSLKKKPSTDAFSPSELPPTSFNVSPTVETSDFPQHKVIKKDRPEEPIDVKVKPPLERRETYEERCRKILGMMEDDTTTVTTTEETTITASKPSPYLEPESNNSSPSVSPCYSPRERSPLAYESEVIDTKYDVTGFVTREKDELVKTTMKRKSMTPSRDSSPTKLKDIISVTNTLTKQDFTLTTTDSRKDTSFLKTTENKYPRGSVSPSRKIPATSVAAIPMRAPSPTKKSEEPRNARSPSPTKKTSKVTEESNQLITTEREQEILNKVQTSLRKLSPARDHASRSPSRERSPNKTTTSLQDIDIVSSKAEEGTIEKKTVIKVRPKETDNKPKPSKLPSRNASPIKKPTAPTPKTETVPETFKPRSTSPRKPVSPTERLASPQVPKTNGTKPREPVSRRPTPGHTSPTKFEKNISSTDLKKAAGVTKQNSYTKTKIATTKVVQTTLKGTKTVETPEPKREVPKENKENVSPKTPKKEVTRTSSDNSMNTKKVTPQRVRSKPEIQVTEVATKTTKHATKTDHTKMNQNSKLSTKPKSATALNTPIDENDVIVDVEQAKSSRENSPDRICPTPVSFLEDVGTPRYPDEVSEPDDEFRRRTHHTIHEKESLVDDIVEISEEEELFTKNVDRITQSDECLLSVNDKVSKFTTKIVDVKKPKDSTAKFRETERKEHSDIDTKNLKSDECLLSVSEKVTKFASGPKDIKNTARTHITEEYDVDTVYTDDYSKRSVNDKAHYFVETAENVTAPKSKPTQKVERPDLSDIDDSIRTDDCLLSVSDKVNKFIKTAEQFLIETHEIDEKERNSKEQHEKIMQVIQNIESLDLDNTHVEKKTTTKHIDTKTREHKEDKLGSFAKETASSHAKNKEYSSTNLKSTERPPIVKITTLRSSEAVKKAKALFENIATTTTNQKTKDVSSKTKLTDIGVIKKSPKTDSTTALHPSLEDVVPSDESDGLHVPNGRDRPSNASFTRSHSSRRSPTRFNTESPEIPRTKSPIHHSEINTTKSVLSRYPLAQKAESPKLTEAKPHYQKPTMTSQLKEETKVEEEFVSSRRGSGKFGVELRKTSLERSTLSSERRRSSDHHQPCIEDIFDVDLLEQMLEKVVGYEQRRRIRAQIRVAKKQDTNKVVDTSTFTRTTKTTTKTRSPERKRPVQKTTSPDRNKASDPVPLQNGYAKEPAKNGTEKRLRPHSPEKAKPQSRSPIRQPSPEKKTRTKSPSKTAVNQKPKPNRFNEYASAYMKKVGLNETEKITIEKPKVTENIHIDIKIEDKPRLVETKSKTVDEVKRLETRQHSTSSISKSYTERSSSKDVFEIKQNGKRSPSPSKTSPTERLYHRSPSPDFKRPRNDFVKQTETIIKTVEDDRKVPKTDEKPSWVTNRNLKKISSETRTFSSKKIDSDKKYRAVSPSKVISKPLDVITSSYGIGPHGADGKPLFGIKALRNGATNYQVKGTVIQQSFTSHNGGAPTGEVSVTAYSTRPGDLEPLLKGQPRSRLHGLAAITTTKKFGGNTGATLEGSIGKEESATLEQFTHSDRRVSDHYSRHDERRESRDSVTRDNVTRNSVTRDRGSVTIEDVTDRRSVERKMERREDKKTVRQSSVKSLTEKFIKNATESSRNERVSYPKAGLILRTTGMKDSVSSDNDIARTDSEHSLYSPDCDIVETRTTQTDLGGGRRQTSTVTTRSKHSSRVISPTENGKGTQKSSQTRSQERSFLDSSTKVTGVQDILTRMRNADIVIEDGDTTEDSEARALLNKFLGATVLMAGMQNYVTEAGGRPQIKKEAPRPVVSPPRNLTDFDVDQCWDEQLLRKLLEECTDYEQRRKLRARLRTLMAEQEACANAVTAALAASGGDAGAATGTGTGTADAREEEEVTTTVTSSVRRDSTEKIEKSAKTSSSSTTTKTTKVIDSMTKPAPKSVSAFAKFRQLEKQNPKSNPNSPTPKTPQSPGSPSQPLFKFTDPALQASAMTIKERLLQWCRDKTRDYENIKLENFSTSWADGLAFCALIHHFLPDAFDYAALAPDKRRHNFTLAFKIADEKAGIYPLLDVDDMVAMRKPDWKCVFTYVQSIHRRFKDQQ